LQRHNILDHLQFSFILDGCAIVAILSLHIRPWAWTQFFLLKAQSEAQFDLTRMQSGNFYEVGDGERVIFADKVHTGENRAEGVFILNKKNTSLQIIYAERATSTKMRKHNPIIAFKRPFA
jgi:lipopolysaccharide export system permease protein